MNTDEVTQRVIGVIAKTIHQPPEAIQPQSTFEELKMDSLDGLQLAFALEEEFDVNIPDDAVKSIKSVPAAVEGIRNLLAEKAAQAG
jgi:acyl carrier protein